MWGTHSLLPAQKAVHSDGHLMKTVLLCCSDCVFPHLLRPHILHGVSLFIVLTATFTIPGRDGLEGSWSQGLHALSTCPGTLRKDLRKDQGSVSHPVDTY